MALFAIVPGMPFIPFMAGSVTLGYAAWRTSHRKTAADDTPLATAEPARRKPIGDVLDFDEIHIEFAPDLVGMALDPATGLEARIANMRTHVAANHGLILPDIRLTDEHALPAGSYRIRIQGVERVRDHLVANRVLCLLADGREAPPGTDVREPVYGAPARWIAVEDQEAAILAGLTVVSAPEVLATHLLEVIRANLGRLLSLRGLRKLLDEFVTVTDPARAEANRRLLEEMVPEKVPTDLLLAVLRLLLEERVSIRNLPLILEAIAEARTMGAPEAVCEHVRHRLGFQLVAELRRADGTIPLIQLAPEWEKTFTLYQIDGDRGTRDVALPPDQFSRLANALADRLNRASETGVFPALVTSTLRRRFLKTVLGAKGLTAPVLSYEEIGLEARPAMVGVVPA
jgi:flagellar biosynthesis protein FlhA